MKLEQKALKTKYAENKTTLGNKWNMTVAINNLMEGGDSKRELKKITPERTKPQEMENKRAKWMSSVWEKWESSIWK